MKTIKKIMMAMFVMACMSLTVSCNKDNDNGGNGGNDNSYSAMLVGTWQIDQASTNGQDITPFLSNIQLSFNANGTGLMNDGGETHNNDFTWSISGNTITVVTSHDVRMEFTINNMTATECSFSGAGMELDGQILENIVIHMVKVNGGGGDNPDPGNNYSTLILGNWQITTAMLDGQDLAGQMGSLILSFYAGGTGLINHNGETENNDFGWSISGNTITITPRGGSYQYTITSLNETTCTFTGNVFPVTGQQGNVSITMTKVGDNPGPVTGSLEGTTWACSFNGTITEQGTTIDYTADLRLAFTTATAGTMTETMTAMGYTQTENQDFTYTYNESTHTGVMSHTYFDDETQQNVTEDLPFAYNPSNNTITVTNPNPGDNPDGFPNTFVFNRVSK